MKTLMKTGFAFLIEKTYSEGLALKTSGKA